MHFYFCEACGKRVTDKDLEAGAARNKKMNGVFCKECAVGVNTLDTAPLSEEEAREELSESPSPPIKPSESGMRGATLQTPSGPKLAATKIRPSTGPKLPGERPARPAATVALQKPSQKPLIFGAVGAGVMILLLAIFVSGSPQSEKKVENETKIASASNDSKPRETQRSTPVVEIQPEPAPVPAPHPEDRAFPNGLLAQSDSKELTPKELHDQAVKEGRLKPDTAPATPPPPASTPATPPANPPLEAKGLNLLSITTPPADDSAWKPLFNGKDLTGWSAVKGTWTFEDGMAQCTHAGDGGARLDGSASFGDFELVVQLQVPMRAYLDVRVRDSKSCDFQLRELNVWHTFRAVAVGDNVQASVDGQPINTSGKCGTSGVLRVYCDKGCTLKVKDMRLRSLTASDLPKK
jgi:hypothetical protein